MHIQPYLDFEGRCEEAVEFYKQAVGAELQGLMRFKDNPEKQQPVTPGTEDKVLHCSMKIGDSIVMASDGRCTGDTKFNGVMLTILLDKDDEAKRYFEALSAGGQIHMPLTKTFFASSFGMLNDKFGVTWMLLAGQQKK